MASRPAGCSTRVAGGFVGAAGADGALAGGVDRGTAAGGVDGAPAGACGVGAAGGDGSILGACFDPGMVGLGIDGAEAVEGGAAAPTGVVRRIVTWIAPFGLENSTWKVSSKCSCSMMCGFVSSDEIWNALSAWFAI